VIGRGSVFPPLRPVSSWDGLRTIYKCDTCGAVVNADHTPGGAECDSIVLLKYSERLRKASDPFVGVCS
jgi:hypothetical protein